MTADLAAAPAVTATLHPNARVEIVLELHGAPDTRHPHGGPTIRPQYLMVTAYPRGQAWQCTWANITGPKVTQNAKGVVKLTQSSFGVMFDEPLDIEVMDDGEPLKEGEWDGRAPDWLRPHIAAQMDRLNGVPPAAAVQQVADEAVSLYRIRDRHLNDPQAHNAVMHYNGVLHGLRIALCLLMGWDVEQESDKEGAADEFIIGRWKELHPEEWTA